MKSIIANLVALGIWVTSGMIVGTPIVVMAQTTEAEMEQLLKQAAQQTQQGQSLQAIETFKQVLLLTEKQKNQQYRAIALFGLGGNYHLINKLQEALDSYEKALLIFREFKERNLEATTLKNIGDIYKDTEKIEQALEYYQQVIPIFRELKNRSEEEAILLTGIGSLYLKMGQPHKALEYYQQALPITQEFKIRLGEATILRSMGAVYNQIGQPQKSLEYYQKALPIIREVKDRKGEVTTLMGIGGVYALSLDMGQPQDALEYYQQSLPIFREIKDRKGEAHAFGSIGVVYDKIGQPHKALEYYQQSLLIQREIEDFEGQTDTLILIGLVYRVIEQPEKTLEYLLQALPILQQINDKKEEARTLKGIGVVYSGIGEPQKALEYYQQALPIFREVGDRIGEAIALDGIGFAYNQIGQPHKALEYYQQSLPIQRKIKYRKGEADTLGHMGSAYTDIGQPQKALEYYQQALPIFREVEDGDGEAATLGNIGKAYSNVGQPQKALEYLQQALSIQREIKDRKGEAVALGNIGGVYSDIGQPQKALEYYQQALPILREVKDFKGEATILSNVGDVYSNIGQQQKALEYYQQSLPIRRETKDRDGEAAALHNMSTAYLREGKWLKAMEPNLLALFIFKELQNRKGEATALATAAAILHLLKQQKEAFEFSQEALFIQREIKDKYGEAAALNNIASIYLDLGQSQKALESFQQALLLQREIKDKNEITTLFNLGIIHRDTLQPILAIESWEASLKRILEIRSGLKREDRQALIRSNQGTANALVDLLITQKQSLKAFQWFNLTTTFDLADYSRLIDAKVQNPEAQKALDELKIKDQQLNDLREQIKDKYSEPLVQQIRTLEAEANRQKEKIINTYPEVAELLETKPTDITQLQKNIPPNTVVIQPALLTNVYKRPDTVALFAVTANQVNVLQNPLPKDFNQLLEKYRQQLESGDSYLTTSSQLYDILIRPLEQKNLIPANSDIAIIATGKLREIPFESLYDNQNKQYLLEKYLIHYLTRLSKAQNNKPTTEQNQSPKPSKALAIANPLPSKQELKNTESEADYLTTTFPNSESYKNQKATLETFKLRAINFSILHLGTHGCFQPQGCQTLGMAPNTLLFANNEQYPIKDAALLGLKNTELLVIGACQTAKITKDDDVGLTGLAYIWERAGAKSVVASLWSAPDQESAELMKRFYGNLKQGMSKAEALRQAKLNILRETPDGKHPFFWSPFVLIGDGGKMGQ